MFFKQGIYKRWNISKLMVHISIKDARLFQQGTEKRKRSKKRQSYQIPKTNKTHSHSQNFPFTKHTPQPHIPLHKKRTYMAASFAFSLPNLFIKKPTKEKAGKSRILKPYICISTFDSTLRFSPKPLDKRKRNSSTAT